MSDLPATDQPEPVDHDDVEGHVAKSGRLDQPAPNTDEDDVEAHSFRRMLDGQSVPAAEDTPDEDDTEGHATRGKG